MGSNSFVIVSSGFPEEKIKGEKSENSSWTSSGLSTGLLFVFVMRNKVRMVGIVVKSYVYLDLNIYNNQCWQANK